MKLTRRGKILLVLGILAWILASLAVGGYVYLRSLGVYGSSHPGALVRVEIPQGASASEIGEILATEDVIPSALGFRITSFLEGGAEDIQAGTYELPRGLTAGDALDRMIARGPIQEFVTVTFPEGSWLEDFARIVERESHISGDAFLEAAASARVKSAVAPDAENLEGLLFPSTYQVVREDTAIDIVRRLVNEFDEQVSKVDLSDARAAGYSPYEVVIIASLVEAEAKVDSDRAKIARVIYNRLDQGMRLEIDATVLYALGEHKETLTESDLAVDSPYNTRVVEGLPPTPIGAAGSASIAAAADPAPGDWLFYVLADCEGHHAFSVDYDDFLADKAAYQALDC